MVKLKVVAVVGPTGSGKTTLAKHVAEKFDGVIISADSRQVYRGLDIGTNKEGQPGKWEGHTARFLDHVPQLLIDVAEPGQPYTLADWLISARELTEKISAAGQLPIIAGGTGLYVSALLGNWTLGPTDPVLQAELAALTVAELQERLIQPLNTADSQNRHRLIRAVEKQELADRSTPVAPLAVEGLVIQPQRDREELFAASDQRIELIFNDLLAEVRGLLQAGISADWLRARGLDYQAAVRLLAGGLSREVVISDLQRDSRRYIRRQETWWRHHGPVLTVANARAAEQAVDSFLG